jgi:alanine racemase
MSVDVLAGLARPNRAEVDLGRLTANTAAVRQLADPGTFLFGAVKGNGYSLGLPEVAHAMRAGGAGGFTLADPADAARIRQAGLTEPILLYGGLLPSPAAVAGLAELDLMCTVVDLAAAEGFSAAAAPSAPVRVFAKVDVGMERLGVYADAALEFVQAVTGLPGLRLEGLYTHLHGSEDRAYTDWQLSRFDQLLAELAGAGIEIPLRMAESSATLGLPPHPVPPGRPGSPAYPVAPVSQAAANGSPASGAPAGGSPASGGLPSGSPARLNAARPNAMDPGHLLYGILPLGRTSLPPGIAPVFRSLTTRILQVKQVRRSDFVALAPFPPRDQMRIGIIPIGRGDGLRCITTGQVRVRGQLVPIIGRLSLEHARIDLAELPGVQPGEEVEIIAGPPGSGISAAEAAAANDLDPVGLLMEIRPSVRRIYRTP